VGATRRILITLVVPLMLLAWVCTPAMTRTLQAILSSDAGHAFILDWTADGDTNGEQFGYAVGTAGDVNGDGFADVIIGAPQDYYTYTEPVGAVYVYHGSAGGLSDSLFPDWAVGGDSTQKGSFFGCAVGTAGDVNGDGNDDVIIGARDYKASDKGKFGAAFVFYGSKNDGLATTPGWSLISDQQDSALGIAVSTAGDVNNDTYDDVIIGASGYPTGGLAFVFLGATDGLTLTHRLTLTVNQPGAQFGIAVRYAGDVNNDGYADIVIGAPGFDIPGTPDVGAAFVYYGSTDGISTTYSTLYGNQNGSRFGAAVAGAGDVNNDGHDDIIVGAQYYSQTITNEGAAFVYLGSPTGILTVPQRMLVGNQLAALFGVAVGTAGDVNNDNYDDIVIGAAHYTNDQKDEGAVFVYLGSPSGVSARPVWRGEGDKSETLFGFAVGTAGDVDDDGYMDLIVGAPDYKTQEQNKRGRAFFYLGTGDVSGYNSVYLPLVLRSSF
jgi:hypothetical protein